MDFFQINDSDGNSMGILKTNAKEKTVTKLYHAFCVHEDYEDVKDDLSWFITYCSSYRPDKHFIRVFITEEINTPEEMNTP